MTCTLRGPKENSFRSRGRSGDREKSITLLVLSNSASDTDTDVLTAAGVEEGDTYNLYGITDDGVYAAAPELSKTEPTADGGALWEVSLKYASNPGDERDDQSQDDGKPAKDPLERFTASWDTDFKQTALERAYLVTEDAAGAVTNVAANLSAPCASNGETLDVKQSYGKPIKILKLSQNMGNFDETQSLLYEGACNSDNYRGKAPGTWKCQSRTAEWSSQKMPDSGLTGYWDVTTKLAYDPDGWDCKFRDMGTVQIKNNGGTYERTPIRDAHGHLPGKPVPLNGAGEKLAESDVAAGAFKYRRYRPPPTWQPFAALNLPEVR